MGPGGSVHPRSLRQRDFQSLRRITTKPRILSTRRGRMLLGGNPSTNSLTYYRYSRGSRGWGVTAFNQSSVGRGGGGGGGGEMEQKQQKHGAGPARICSRHSGRPCDFKFDARFRDASPPHWVECRSEFKKARVVYPVIVHPSGHSVSTIRRVVVVG